MHRRFITVIALAALTPLTAGIGPGRGNAATVNPYPARACTMLQDDGGPADRSDCSPRFESPRGCVPVRQRRRARRKISGGVTMLLWESSCSSSASP